jgi:hypothetical protein
MVKPITSASFTSRWLVFATPGRPLVKPTIRIRPNGATHRLVEYIAAHRIEDHIGPAPVGQRPDLVPEALAVVDHVVGSEPLADLEALGGACRGDNPRAHQLAHVDRGEPNAAGGAVHQQGLACLQPTSLQGVIGGRVVGAKRGSRLEAYGLGQPDEAVGQLHRLLGEAAAAQHAIADLQAFDVGAELQDLSSGLATGDERWRRLDVILAGDAQHVGIAHPTGTQAYLDLGGPG